MRVIKFISLAVILIGVSTLTMAQDKEQAATVKHVPISNVSSTSGKEMYNSYCAVCHGKDGKGGGPAVSALKTAPPDLTGLAKKNGGKYPSAHVAAVIRGQGDLAAHGSPEMPIWGPLFSSISQGHQGIVQQRVANLVAYIETLQAK
jgi:mono/diheme cytochrome c family protein